MEEKSVFEAAALNEALPENVGEEMSPDEEEQTEFAPKVSKESPKEKLERTGTKKKSDGNVLTIKSYFFTRPKVKDLNRMTIEPKVTQTEDKKPYYPGKLGIRFAEDNLIEYYPNFRYFVGENGNVNAQAKINRKGENAVTAIFKLVIAKLGKPEDEVSDFEAFEFLKGKQVKIKTVTGKYKGKEWFRNDIVEIL